MVERGKLGLAAQCLERAAALAPHQDYVHRHLAIVKARISRLSPEQRDTEVFDDSFWQNGPKERNFNMGDISNSNGIGSTSGTSGLNNMENSQFLGKTDSVFSNHHNHISHKRSNTDSTNHMVHLKSSSKPARVTLTEMKPEVKNTHIDHDKSNTNLNNQQDYSSGNFFSKNMNSDATELTIDRERAINSEKFDRTASAFSTSGKHGTIRRKDTALS